MASNGPPFTKRFMNIGIFIQKLKEVHTHNMAALYIYSLWAPLQLSCKKCVYWLHCVCLSVFLSTCNNFKNTEWIFMKFDTGEVY
jgi:hypothetical protein